ncbi:MAG: transcriptional repressor [Elusimicrobiota bacterium]
MNHKQAPHLPQEIVLFAQNKSVGVGSTNWRRDIVAKFHSYLVDQGLRPTHQRHVILTYLLRSTRHLSADEIFKAVRKEDVTIGKATVFRTLRLLEGCKLARCVMKGNGTAYYEIHWDRPAHDHAICVSCGSIQEFECMDCQKQQDRLASKFDFTAMGHRHEVFGHCASCRRAGVT